MHVAVRSEGKDEHADGGEDTADGGVVKPGFGDRDTVVARLGAVVEVFGVEVETEGEEDTEDGSDVCEAKKRGGARERSFSLSM